MQNEMDKLFEEGVNFYEQSRMDEAETKFLEALQIDSSSEEIKYNLALVYLEKKEYNKTNLLISQIKEIDCDEIVDELEKVDFDFQNETQTASIVQSINNSLEDKIKLYIESLNDEYLPKIISCEFCDSEIELSEIERQNKYYLCPECNNQTNVREKERALENGFRDKPDSELFEILIESNNFKLQYIFAAKKEIKRRNINLAENEDFKSLLINYM